MFDLVTVISEAIISWHGAWIGLLGRGEWLRRRGRKRKSPGQVVWLYSQSKKDDRHKVTAKVAAKLTDSNDSRKWLVLQVAHGQRTPLEDRDEMNHDCQRFQDESWTVQSWDYQCHLDDSIVQSIVQTWTGGILQQNLISATNSMYQETYDDKRENWLYNAIYNKESSVG